MEQGVKTYKKVKAESQEAIVNFGHSLENATTYAIKTTGECFVAGKDFILRHPKETAFVIIVGAVAYVFPPAIVAM